MKRTKTSKHLHSRACEQEVIPETRRPQNLNRPDAWGPFWIMRAGDWT